MRQALLWRILPTLQTCLPFVPFALEALPEPRESP